MRDLGSAADQRWALPEAHGEIGAAADPGRAVANGLSGKGVSQRAVGRGEPPPEGRQDSLDGPGELKGVWDSLRTHPREQGRYTSWLQKMGTAETR